MDRAKTIGPSHFIHGIKDFPLMTGKVVGYMEHADVTTSHLQSQGHRHWNYNITDLFQFGILVTCNLVDALHGNYYSGYN